MSVWFPLCNPNAIISLIWKRIPDEVLRTKVYWAKVHRSKFHRAYGHRAKVHREIPARQKPRQTKKYSQKSSYRKRLTLIRDHIDESSYEQSSQKEFFKGWIKFHSCKGLYPWWHSSGGNVSIWSFSLQAFIWLPKIISFKIKSNLTQNYFLSTTNFKQRRIFVYSLPSVF